MANAGHRPGADPGARFPLWSLRDDVYIESEPRDPAIVVHSRWADTILPRPSAGVLDALRRMSLGPVSLDNAVRDRADRAELGGLLDRLEHLVVRSFGVTPDRPLISVIPMTEQARFRLPPVPLPRPGRLSRFALIRTDRSSYCIESPLSLHRVILHGDEALAELGALFRAVTPSAAQHPHSALTYLAAAGMVVLATGGSSPDEAQFAEDTDPALAFWAPVDLMFHTRSTLGRHDRDFGATYPLGELGSQEPVVSPPRGGEYITLQRPRWDDLLSKAPLTAAVEARHRAADYGPQPVTEAELGELLYRAARVRSLAGSPDAASATATSDRPYPSGGDCYELELYPVVNNCAGIPRGAYHYDPYRHRLEGIETAPAGIGELLEKGRVMAGLPAAPPVLLAITARFRRLSWKYNGLSYALALREVGALTQTLALVGTAMGLDSCVVDSADIEASARVLGLDWRTESGVGGVVVGHRAGQAPGDNARKYPANDPEWITHARAVLSI
jgi:SagB-type dehydrogenase family enzyme